MEKYKHRSMNHFTIFKLKELQVETTTFKHSRSLNRKAFPFNFFLIST